MCRAKTVGQAGVLLTAPLFGVVLGSYLSGHMRFTGRYKLSPLVGLAVATAAFLVLAVAAGTLALAAVVGLSFLLGVGIGASLPPMMVASQNSVPAGDIGIATAVHTFFRAVGGAIGVAVFSAVVLHLLGPLGSQLETAHAAQGTVAGDAAAQEAVHAFSVFFGACALTLALAWAARARRSFHFARPPRALKERSRSPASRRTRAAARPTRMRARAGAGVQGMSGATTTTRHGDLIGAGLILLLTASAPTVEWLPPERRAPLNAGAIPRAYGRQLRHPVFMAYTLPGGFVLGSLFNHQRFGLCVHRAFRFERVAVQLPVRRQFGGAGAGRRDQQLAARPGRQAGGIMLIGIGAHALAGRQCAVPQIRPHEIHPWPGCEGRGAAGWAPESTSRTIASLACLRLRISPSTLSGSCIPALEGRAPDSRTRP